ncbi:MAG: DUF4215 domain-containing protein [Deltaproteobacteria bacterium]|nr:DUF4215 domain-containing protein [Deltaproteobacteria bacterium]
MNAARRSVALALAVAAACGEKVEEQIVVEQGVTGIDLSVIFDTALGLDQMRISGLIGALNAFTPGELPETPEPLATSPQTVVILLPDSMAGLSVEVRVDGLAGGQIRGTGLATVILAAKTLVSASITIGKPWVCGDGIVRDDKESCDDAGSTEPGCDATCLTEGGYTCEGEPSVCTFTCGNDLVDGGEQCDDPAPAEDGDGCSAACTVEAGHCCVGEPSDCSAVCGDGAIAICEQCDDDDTDDGDGCSSGCRIEEGYTCDNTPPPSVCIAGCGNGTVGPGEQCDDGDQMGGDGCAGDCTLEAGWCCTGQPSSCAVNTCGDGNATACEGCDGPAPADDGDGCSADCTVEPGYYCSGSPSTCQLIPVGCGNGSWDGIEGCDDGNNVSGDGCSAICTIEAGWECDNVAGQASRCKKCGNGKVEAIAGETCDDGNLNTGDGCLQNCKVQSGWYCCTTAGATPESTCCMSPGTCPLAVPGTCP